MDKMTKAWAKAAKNNVFCGRETQKHIMATMRQAGIGGAELAKMTGAQIALLITAMNLSYHNGRASCDAEYLTDDGAVWIGGEVQSLFEIADLKALAVK